MKKFISCLVIAFSFTSCSTPSNNNPSGVAPTNGVSASPSTSPSGNSSGLFKTKQDFIKFTNCLIEKNSTGTQQTETLKAYYGSRINLANMLTDADWSASSFNQMVSAESDDLISKGQSKGCTR